MWDKQQGVKGPGDYPLYENTAYSIELFAASEVPEWGGKIVRIMLEEDGVYSDGQFYFCLLYTSPSPRDRQKSRMPSSA